jgi:hypothetical protein
VAYVKIDFKIVLSVVESDNPGMATLGYCLTDDVMYGGGQRRISWILDDRYSHGCSNRTFMEKYDGNVAVGDLFTEDPREAAISVPIPVMIDLLQQWDEVCKTNPDVVTIYCENEKFRIEPQKSVCSEE